MNFLLLSMLSSYAFGSIRQYDHTKIMWSSADEDIYTVHWTISGTYIDLALEVKTTGWVGFGIAEQSSGTMGGSDIVQGYVTTDGEVEIQDSYALSQISGTNIFTAPNIDACDDWTIIRGIEDDGKTILELRRLIDTGDSQDRPFLLDKVTKVVMAYGQDGEDSFGVQHLGTNRKAGFINLSGENVVDAFQSLIDNPEIETLEFLNNWTMTTAMSEVNDWTADSWSSALNSSGLPQDIGWFVSADTVYVMITMDMSVIQGEYYIVGFEHVLSERSKEYVHHMVVMSGVQGAPQASELIYPWVPGVEPMILENCGWRGSDIAFLQMNTHYNNVALNNGVLDTSGIRIYYTRNMDMREHDCGILNLGDASLKLGISQPPPSLPEGVSSHEFSCPSMTAESVSWGDITDVHVFASIQHMHIVGRQIWTEQYRNGELLATRDRIDFWDQNFETSTRYAEGEYVINKHDSFKHTCVFDVNDPVTWGFRTGDEMCVGWVLYYPRIPGLGLHCTYETQSSLSEDVYQVTNLSALTQDFGTQAQDCSNIDSNNDADHLALDVSFFLILMGIFTRIVM